MNDAKCRGVADKSGESLHVHQHLQITSLWSLPKPDSVLKLQPSVMARMKLETD